MPIHNSVSLQKHDYYYSFRIVLLVFGLTFCVAAADSSQKRIKNAPKKEAASKNVMRAMGERNSTIANKLNVVVGYNKPRS